MLLDLRSLVEQAQVNTASAKYAVTVTTATGTVANPVVGSVEATFGVTVATSDGTVTNPRAESPNVGITYSKPAPRKPRPPQPVFTLPIPEAPTYRIHGNVAVTYEVTRAEAQGIVGKYVIGGSAAASFAAATVRAEGTSFRRRVSGHAHAQVGVTRTYAHGVNDRSLWNQIEEEDQWLTDVLNVLSIAA